MKIIDFEGYTIDFYILSNVMIKREYRKTKEVAERLIKYTIKECRNVEYAVLTEIGRIGPPIKYERIK